MRVVIDKDITADREVAIVDLTDQYQQELHKLFPGLSSEWLLLVGEAERYIASPKKGSYPLLALEAGDTDLRETAEKIVAERDEINARIAELKRKYTATKEKLQAAKSKIDLKMDEPLSIYLDRKD